MASIIIPAHHEYVDQPFLTSPIDIMNVRTVSMEWYWPVTNTSVAKGYVNYWIELTHDMGWGHDVSWLVYEPGAPSNLAGPGPEGLQYKGPQRGGIFGEIFPLEAQGFYALRGDYGIIPGGNQGIAAGATTDARGELTIPGGRASPAAGEFWTKMLRQFRQGLKFHLTVKLYAHDGTNLDPYDSGRDVDFFWKSAGATWLGEHTWKNIFEVDD